MPPAPRGFRSGLEACVKRQSLQGRVMKSAGVLAYRRRDNPIIPKSETEYLEKQLPVPENRLASATGSWVTRGTVEQRALTA
jgi:hypothetical protein